MGDDNTEINKELEDIQEDEVKYDSDGVARGQSPGRPPSATGSIGSSGSVASSGSGSRGKRRSWKKPKDKPKRPLSAYNIFFKHERSRIVEGRADNPTPEEIIISIEQILSTSRETRRHRKTHGRISFGDLARKIAEQWKTVDKDRKAVFEHYAEIDMRRYRKELRAWKERKEQQSLTGSSHTSSISSLEAGLEDEAELSLDQIGHSSHSNSLGGSFSNSFNNSFGPRPNLNSSFSSIDSSEVSLLEPIPINDMIRNSGSSLPNLGMEVGVPVPGIVPSNNVFQSMQNNNMQNMQPRDIQLFNQQQQLLQNMQFGQPQGQGGQNFPANDLHQERQSLEQQRQQLLILQQQQQLLQQQLIQQQNNLRIQQGQLAQQQANFALSSQGAVPQAQVSMNQPNNMPGDAGGGTESMVRPSETMSQMNASESMVRPPETMSQMNASEDIGGNDLLESFIQNLDLSPSVE